MLPSDCALNVAPARCSHLRLVTLPGPGPSVLHLAPDHTEPLGTGHHPPLVTGHWPLPREPRAETCSQTQLRDGPSVAEQEEIRTLTMSTKNTTRMDQQNSVVTYLKFLSTCPCFKHTDCFKSKSWVSESCSLLCWHTKHAVPSFLCFCSFLTELWWLESFLSETLSWENYLKQNISHQN